MPLFIVAFGILLLLILMLAAKFNTFLSLLLVSLAVGLMEGMPMEQVVSSIQKGMGDTLGFLALLLGLGAMLGKLLSDSGAAQRIAYSLIHVFGIKQIQWAAVATGFVVGSTMFYNAGFIILVPLIFTIARTTGAPYLFVGIPMAAALSVTHGFLPPHPGPTAIAAIYKADIGLTLLYGIIVAIPAIVLAGPFLGSFLKKVKSVPAIDIFNTKTFTEEEMPGFGISIANALIPVALMALNAASELVLPEGNVVRAFFSFAGNPMIALLISVIFAVFTLGLSNKKTMADAMKSITDSTGGIAMILLIIGAGGAFKQVLIDSGVGTYITGTLTGTGFSPIVLCWGIAAVLRVTLGSATVSAITTAGIVLPLIEQQQVSPELMVLATGAGSLMFSHVNDPGFWMFKEFFGLSVTQTFASWSVMETIVSVVGLLGVLALTLLV